MRTSARASASLVVLGLATSAWLTACKSHGASSVDQPLASAITVTEVSVFQGLKASVMLNGGAVANPVVPLVANRPGLLRVYLEPSPSFTSHEVVVVLELTQAGAALPAMEARVTPTGPSVETDLASTANFDLPGTALTTDVTFAVSVHETTAGKQGTDVSGARYPTTDQVAMGATTTGIVKVTLLPITYQADGSNRTPTTTDADLERFRDRMLALYPVSDVQITVGETLKWPDPVEANGNGWDTLLNTVINQRQQDGVAPDEYYYGLFTPAASFGAYCGNQCTTGLSTLSAHVSDDWARASIGISYTNKDADAAGTFVHEVGHAHGRQHAPCMVDDPDPNYPYSDATIGSFGYDATAKAIIDPSGTSRDMMSYCDPIWISDYTYKAIYARVRALAAQADRVPHRASWRSIVVGANGAKRGQVVTADRDPDGTDKLVERVVDGRTEQVTAHFYPFDHLPGGILLLPESDDVGTLRVDGHLIK